MYPINPVSVSQLNSYIGRVLSMDSLLMNVSVFGEVANLTKHSSGHWYFSLKDKNSKINCFLSSYRVSSLRYDFEEGMQITAIGQVSVYEKGGYYSLNIRDVEVEGEGELQKAFNLLKDKLEKEGLFDPEHKKEIPLFPKKVGVITSPTGAAIKDIVSTVKRRNPMVDILLYPALVQGDGSAASICEAIKAMNTFSDIDVLIVGRGGGSMEDLWTFNEESVARCIYDSAIPVISAVGHEIDFVISDFAADLRAATPTAAAELAVPHIENYLDIINACSPQSLFTVLREKTDSQERRLINSFENAKSLLNFRIAEAESKLQLLKLSLDSLNPLNVFDKGYAAVQNSEGKWISSVDEFKENEEILISLKDGKVSAVVKGIGHGKKEN